MIILFALWFSSIYLLIRLDIFLTINDFRRLKYLRYKYELRAIFAMDNPYRYGWYGWTTTGYPKDLIDEENYWKKWIKRQGTKEIKDQINDK